MGELKNVAENQAEVKLVDRVKDLGNQVYLAGLGLVAKVEEEGQKQLDKLQAAGQALVVKKPPPTRRPCWLPLVWSRP